MSRLKRTHFYKKHHVKFPVDPRARQLKKPLEYRAKKIITLIFKGLPCVMKNSDCRGGVVPHHILNKGMYDHLRFALMNLLPMCVFHHDWAHSKAGDFLYWLQENMPKHYIWRLKEKDDKKPVKRSAGDLQDDIDELQYYLDHPMEAEKLIYEKS